MARRPATATALVLVLAATAALFAAPHAAVVVRQGANDSAAGNLSASTPAAPQGNGSTAAVPQKPVASSAPSQGAPMTPAATASATTSQAGSATNTSATTASSNVPAATSAPLGPTATSGPSTAAVSGNTSAVTVPNSTAVPTSVPAATPVPNVTAVPNASTTPRSDSSNETNNGSSCFPAIATVELESGAIRRMDQIVAGDRLKVASGVFSEVFMFTHKLPVGSHQFVALQTASGNRIALTSGHYIHVNGALAPAGAVVVGDRLQLGSGESSIVTSISYIESTGLYNPQTLHGDIVVDGIRASTYTTAVEPRLAHAGLALLRVLYRALGITVSAFDNGADSIADVLPSGVAAY